MKLFGKLSTGIFVFAVLLAGATAAFSQGDPKSQLEASYDMSLRIIVGSGDTAKGELPADLAAVGRQLKGAFPFTSYRVANTLMGRISDDGSYEYKSVGNIFGRELNTSSPTFLEWTLSEFHEMPAAKGGRGFRVRALRFGARVPLTMGMQKDEAGKASPTVTYEQMGVSLKSISLPENVPTLVGTLNLPGTDGTLFLVMTIRAADQ